MGEEKDSSKEKEFKLNSWLMFADFEYLSARCLMMHSIFPVALVSASRAIEIYLKIIVYLNGKQTIKELKSDFSHNLSSLIKEANIQLNDSLHNFVKELEKAYKNRYPDEWESDVKWMRYLDEVDIFVLNARNHVYDLATKKGNKEKIQDILQSAYNNVDNFDSRFEFGSMDFPSIFKRGNKVYRNFKFFTKA